MMSVESCSLEVYHLSITSRILDCNYWHLDDDCHILVPVVLYSIFGHLYCSLCFARQLFKIKILLPCISDQEW